jgi:hypothetical protein
MTIREYLDSRYDKTAKEIHSVYLHEVVAGGPFHTIKDFYDGYIKNYLLDPKNVLAWHEMLMEYVDRPDAVLWVRRFESGGDKTTGWTNRRGCYTECEDGFKYVFVSNYDAQEIFIMIASGVIPDVDEFAELMSKGEFPMHYSSDAKCEESSIARYPQIKVSRAPVELNAKGWYFAHIAGVNGRFLRTGGAYSGKYRALDDEEVEKIYKKGSRSDWDPKTRIRHRNIAENLEDFEKEIVKAHFLRFIDPLNYFLVPKQKKQTNDAKGNIGEYDLLTRYVQEQFEAIYGSALMDAFKKKALIAPDDVIDIVCIDNTKKKRSSPVKKPAASPAKSSKKPSTASRPSTTRRIYTEDDKLELAKYYLEHEDGLETIEEIVYHRPKGNGGSTAKNHLNKMGITTDGTKAGILLKHDIHVERATASGTYADTLDKIIAKFKL